MESSRGDGQATRAGSDPVVVRGCQVETAPLRSFLRTLGRPRVAWASATTTIAAGGAAATIAASGPGRFETVREESQALFDRLRAEDRLPSGARPRLLGGFSFTDEHDDTAGRSVWQGYPGAQFVLPAVQLTVTADGTWLTTAGTGVDADRSAGELLKQWRTRIQALPELSPSTPPGVSDQRYTPSRATWRDQVGSAIDRIEGGTLRKVVLAQSLSVALKREPAVPDVLARLGTSYPGCHRFLFEPDSGNAFFGATPERLVRLRGDTVDTEALAGSIGRGETTKEDEWLATELRNSEKNNHEHDLVREAIHDQLGTLTTERRTGTQTIRKLANVQHLQTPIRATTSGDVHVLSLVEALHPTPAVGGLPPDEALRTIRDTEAFERGWYAAPVGWLDADGDGTFAVAIRSGVLEGTVATLFAGAGVVSDSDPDVEWDELQLKYQPVLDQLD